MKAETFGKLPVTIPAAYSCGDEIWHPIETSHSLFWENGEEVQLLLSWPVTSVGGIIYLVLCGCREINGSERKIGGVLFWVINKLLYR
jgi:hypothetical protein